MGNCVNHKGQLKTTCPFLGSQAGIVDNSDPLLDVKLVVHGVSMISRVIDRTKISPLANIEQQRANSYTDHHPRKGHLCLDTNGPT